MKPAPAKSRCSEAASPVPEPSVGALESNPIVPDRAAPIEATPSNVSSADEQRASGDPIVQRFQEAVEGRLVTVKPAAQPAGPGDAEAMPEDS